MDKLFVVFRTDASTSIGTGHVMRCLTLAGVLKEKGATVFFICREHDGHLCNLIEDRGFSVYRLSGLLNPAVPSHVHSPYHAPWLGVSWEMDAEQTVKILNAIGEKPDFLIVDHYALDERWEKQVRSFVHRIFVIDDLADRMHDCDLLLDQNIVLNMHSRYEGKIPKTCRLMLGPRFTLLQSVYADLHVRVPPRESPVRRILIFFGGVDRDNLTQVAIEAVIGLNRSDIEVDVVLSERSPYRSQVEKMLKELPGFRLYGDLPSLASLIVKADLAIGAAGVTSWERLCLGLPALVITTAENQISNAEGLEYYGLIKWIGSSEKITAERISEHLKKLIIKEEIREWSSECFRKVDGYGTVRVISVLLLSHHTKFHVRRACLSDEEMLLSWANDPLTRRNSFSPDEILPDIHRRWFYSKLRNVDSVFMYIIETEDQIPIGQVRFEESDGRWGINYSLAAEFRNMGLGKKMLNASLCAFRREHKGVLVVGKVKEENISSCKVFEALKFSPESDGEVVAYQRLL